MANCINLKIPATKKAFEELSSIFNNENIAYAILSKNNGFNLDKTPNGNSSLLFLNLKQKLNRKKALKEKAIIYTPEFLSINNWIGVQEPTIDMIDNFKNTELKKKANISEYSKDDVVFVSSNSFNEGALLTAISKGIKAFTMKEVSKLTKAETLFRDTLLEKSFEYTEKDGIGFYTKALQEQEKKMMENNNINTLQVNGVSIDLRKLGFNFKPTKDQLQTVQEAADWIDGKELKQKAVSSYKGEVTYLKQGEAFVFATDATGELQSDSGTTAGVYFERKPGEATGFKNRGKGKQTYGLITKNQSHAAIVNGITNFYKFAAQFPNGRFKVGIKDETLAQAFADAGNIPTNVIFEESFSKLVYDRVPNKNKENFVLTGNAGTGKTTVTSIIIEYAKQRKKSMVVSSTTHKAVKVQKRMFGSRVTANTLHSALGLTPNIKPEEFDMKNLTFLSKQTLGQLQLDVAKNLDVSRLSIGTGDILVIDEASMVNDALYEYANVVADYVGFKILYIGDDKQLKPVKKSYISKVFRDITDKHISRLTTQVRQESENSLNGTLVKLRRNQKTTKEPLGTERISSISKDGKEGLEWVKDQGFDDSIAKLFKSDNFLTNAEYVKIVAYRNQTVKDYNLKVRKILNREDEIEPNEILMAYESVSVGKNKEGILNSADYRVLNKKDTVRDFVHPLEPDIKVSLPGIEVVLQDTMEPNIKSKFYILSRSTSAEDKVKIARMLRESLQQYHKLKKQKRTQAANAVYRSYMTFKNSFLTFEDLTIPGDNNNRTGRPTVHKPKSIDYGYAVTSHKSQGSTYNYVLVDEKDIDTIYQYDVESTNQSKYVAFSRASKGVIANTKGKIMNNDSFNFTEEIGYKEDVDLIDSKSDTIKALQQDGIATKIC